jgi:hypothetical protein
LPPPSGPGVRANVLVWKDAPQYQRMVERAKSPNADPKDFKVDPEGRGLWVALSWFDGPGPLAKTFKVPTDDDLRTMYPKPKADEGEAA